MNTLPNQANVVRELPGARLSFQKVSRGEAVVAALESLR